MIGVTDFYAVQLAWQYCLHTGTHTALPSVTL